MAVSFARGPARERPLRRADSRPARPPAPAGLPRFLQSQPRPDRPGGGQPREGEPEISITHEGGATERVDVSRIRTGIWWFDGETPTLGAYYPTEVTLSTGLPASGRFRYRITRGADKLGLVHGGGVTPDVSLRGEPRPKVRSTGASDRHGDIELTVEHTPPGAKAATRLTAPLETRAPSSLDLLGCSHAADGAHGYRSEFRLRVRDNFGEPVPYIDVNEDFTSGTLARGVSNDWLAPLRARHKGSTITTGGAEFKDNYAAVASGAPPPSMVPAPENPRSPLGSTPVAEFTHWWYVGSRTPGKGVKVSEHIGRFYSDHGQYLGFLSPPFYVIRPVDCP